jgi:hypothetical protein
MGKGPEAQKSRTLVALFGGICETSHAEFSVRQDSNRRNYEEAKRLPRQHRNDPILAHGCGL